jgi:ribonuclease J
MESAGSRANKHGSVKLVALGGLGEIGLNLMVLECAGDAVVVDAGVMFPEQRSLGVDLLIPEMTYLDRRRIVAVILTHAHDDHIGALPFLLTRYPVPVYGSELTIAMARQRLQERAPGREWDLRTIRPRETFTTGPFQIEALRVTHSTPDSLALAIDTPAGMIIHTGDFKIDDAPVDGERFDMARFTELGEAGVRLLLSDSTNVERAGRTASESSLKPVLREVARKTTGKFLLSGFSSHLHRFRQFAEVCHEQGRRVAILGRRIGETTRLGIATGHLPLPPGTFIDEREIAMHPDARLGFLTGGSQAEPLSAMVRIAAGVHPRLHLAKGDVVVLSSRFIPGNERLIHRLINDLYRLGADVYYEGVAPVHVSGHASRDELAEIIRLTRPEFFVPIHGEYRHLKRHIDVALECGLPARGCFLLQDGEPLTIDAAGAHRGAKVESGRTLWDGQAIEPEALLFERQALARSGTVAVMLVVDRRSGEILAGPDLVSRGFISGDGYSEHLMRAREELRRSLEERLAGHRRPERELKEEVVRTLRAYFAEEVGRTPVILPWVAEL